MVKIIQANDLRTFFLKGKNIGTELFSVTSLQLSDMQELSTHLVNLLRNLDYSKVCWHKSNFFISRFAWNYRYLNQIWSSKGEKNDTEWSWRLNKMSWVLEALKVLPQIVDSNQQTKARFTKRNTCSHPTTVDFTVTASI